ncbi:DUF4189 domain-containing protein [Lysobacter sp. M15]|uniref:DUF4189 domain-containing protein n=1 Tax=Lysobacter sp. M15 TaxID=2916837 RepID=UPI001F56771C|nr:DUF4189 domain-containing protein [Lysobacter sp. M15]
MLGLLTMGAPIAAQESMNSPDYHARNNAQSVYYQGPGRQQSQALQQAPIRLPDVYSSFVSDLDGYKLYWSTFARSGEEAERVAMDACRNNGGENCQPRGWFSNQCGAIAVNPAGKIFEGYGVHPLIAAQKGLRECNEATEGRPAC